MVETLDETVARFRAAYLEHDPDEAREVIARREPELTEDDVPVDALSDDECDAIGADGRDGRGWITERNVTFTERAALDRYRAGREPRYLHFLILDVDPTGETGGKIFSVSLREGVDFLDEDVADHFGDYYVLETADDRSES